MSDPFFRPPSPAGSADTSDTETPAQKRLRIAKHTLASRDEREVSSSPEPTQNTTRKLTHLAKYFGTEPKGISRSNKRGASITGIVMIGEKVFVSDKNGEIQTYTQTSNGIRKKKEVIKAHTKSIAAMAASADGKYIATGSLDKTIKIWKHQEEAKLELLQTFTHHRGAITALAFSRSAQNTLYSASTDLTIKVWNIDEMGYIETLFGHQAPITDLSTYNLERCVSVGGQDRSLRMWKIAEESQLVFRANAGPTQAGGEGLERCAMVQEDKWVTGSDYGALALFTAAKRKPVHTIPHAHKTVTPHPSTEKPCFTQEVPSQDMVVALVAVPGSDLVISGGHDGFIRFWQVIEAGANLPRTTKKSTESDAEDDDDDENNEDDEEEEILKGSVEDNDMESIEVNTRFNDPNPKRGGLKYVSEIAIDGYINSMSVLITKDTRLLLVGTSREHRNGRWRVLKGVKDRLTMFTF